MFISISYVKFTLYSSKLVIRKLIRGETTFQQQNGLREKIQETSSNMSTTDNGVSPSNPITTLSPFSQGKQEKREHSKLV